MNGSVCLSIVLRSSEADKQGNSDTPQEKPWEKRDWSAFHNCDDQPKALPSLKKGREKKQTNKQWNKVLQASIRKVLNYIYMR